MNLLVILQATSDVATTVAEQTLPKMNLWTMTKYGGPIMIILAAMLAIAIYLFIERLITINEAAKEDSSLWKGLRIIFMMVKLKLL